MSLNLNNKRLLAVCLVLLVVSVQVEAGWIGKAAKRFRNALRQPGRALENLLTRAPEATKHFIEVAGVPLGAMQNTVGGGLGGKIGAATHGPVGELGGTVAGAVIGAVGQRIRDL